MDNNAWYAFRRLQTRGDQLPVRAYFILESTPAHRARVSRLPQLLQHGIVWRNSRLHQRVFDRAHRFFIALSFQDIEPTQVSGQSRRSVPLVHLQHGTIGLKQVGYRGDYYRNTIDAFCVYTNEEASLLERHNRFREEQLFRLEYPPRYGKLLETQARIPTKSGRVLWFLTWRDYLEASLVGGDAAAAHSRTLAETVASTLAKSPFADAVKRGEFEVDVCFHQLFPREVMDDIQRQIDLTISESQTHERIRLHHATDVNLMELMAGAETLITDYSSLAYDMTFLGKPVCMYLFDVTEYLVHRDTYIDLREVFTEHVAYEPADLDDVLRRSRGSLHPYYGARVAPPQSSSARLAVVSGQHIDPLLEAMAHRDRVAPLVPIAVSPADRLPTSVDAPVPT
jgi:hypothetical protein